jgi:cleavage and polyadenylation specificity factor subunit 5
MYFIASTVLLLFLTVYRGFYSYPLSNFTFRYVNVIRALLSIASAERAHHQCPFLPHHPCPTQSTKEAQPEEDPSVSARLQRLQNNYEDFGMRRTVEGILVVHDHGHPHILMLQIANAFFKLYALLLSP